MLISLVLRLSIVVSTYHCRKELIPCAGGTSILGKLKTGKKGTKLVIYWETGYQKTGLLVSEEETG